MCDFALKKELTECFLEEGEERDNLDGISYLPWRNANFVFHKFLNFFDSQYSIAILKGLIKSSGGLTESLRL